MDKQASKHAKALSELGAAKGGKARAESLTPEQRSEIARYAAQKRWGDKSGIPRATHGGALSIGDAIIPCYVLQSKQRILSTRGVMKGLQRRWRGRKYAGTELPVFLEAGNLKPFITEELRPVLSPMIFVTDKGLKSEGYRAEALPEVCEIYLKARDRQILTKPQEAIAKRCEILMRALSKVGIIALIDEAAGYQDERPREELAKILEAYIVEELRPWLKTFPDEFFKQIYRLHGWPYRVGNTKRSSYVGKLINKYIYEQLPPPVLPELRKLNPVNDRGYRRHKHFQYLTSDTGNVHLDRQITAVTTILKVSDDRKDFEENFKKAFGKPYQPNLPLVVEIPPEEKKG